MPESSLRPQPISGDLTGRFFGASSTNTSLERKARAGLKPLFVGNKPLTEAAKDVQAGQHLPTRGGIGAVPAQEHLVHVLRLHR